MTKEQLNAIEEWIKALIDERDRASGTHEAVRAFLVKEDVERVFGLRDKETA